MSKRSDSQPEASGPTIFIEPSKATALAAMTVVNPCSTAWGMRCVPTRPFDVYPQMKKLPARSQKSRVRIAAGSGVQRRAAPILGPFRRGDDGTLPERSRAGLLGSIAHEDGDRNEHRSAGDEHDPDRPSPPFGDGQLRHRRNEDQLAGAAGSEGADDQPTVGPEPAVGHGGAEDPADRTGADANGQPPEEVHLPDVLDEQEADEPRDDEQVPDEHDQPRPKATDERSAERPPKPEGEDAERDGERDFGS